MEDKRYKQFSEIIIKKFLNLGKDMENQAKEA